MLLTHVSVISTKLIFFEMNFANFSSSVTHTPGSSSDVLTRRMSSLGGIGREAEGLEATRLARANRGKIFLKSMVKAVLGTLEGRLQSQYVWFRAYSYTVC
jgi:hypothetical protein